MNSKKCLILVVTFATCLLGLHTMLWGQDPNDIAELKKIIANLEKQIEQKDRLLEKIKEDLLTEKKEKERLIKLCREAGINFEKAEDEKIKTQDEAFLIRKPFYDIYLGEDINSLREREDVNQIASDVYSVKSIESKFPEFFDVCVCTFNNKIYSIKLNLRGSSDDIKSSLTQKYGKPKETKNTVGGMWWGSSSVYTTMIGRYPVEIALHQSLGPQVKGGAGRSSRYQAVDTYGIDSQITYTHKSLEEKAKKYKDEQKKARRETLKDKM